MPATDSFLRDLKKMHVVFALSAVVMLVSVLWMMKADHSGEWRNYQKTAYALEAKLKEQDYEEVLKASQATVQQQNLAEKIKQANENLAKHKARLVELEQEIADLEQQQDLQSRALKAQSAERDVARANYDLAVRDEAPQERLDALQAEFDRRQQIVDETSRQLEQTETQLIVLRTERNDITSARDEVQDEIRKLTRAVEQAREAWLKIDPESTLSRVKRKIMEWPIIDGFNSHLAIRQDWLPHLSITLGMTETARFDRCRSCHVNIDQGTPGAPKYPHGHPDSDELTQWISTASYPHPFSSHPRLDLYTTSVSPHPVQKFGCTICHDGNGSGTSFQNAEHGPSDPYEAEQWEEEYGFHPNHFWEYPMRPDRFVESSCVRCHHNVVELGVNDEFGPTAPNVYAGYRLVEQYGCYGCHEIHGYDSGEPIGPDLRLEPQTAEQAEKIASDPSQIAGQLRKVGPSLAHVANKTSQDFVRYWTEEPKKFRPTTRMPQFFHLIENGQYDDVAQRFEPVEIAAISRYLFQKSSPLNLDSPAEDYTPNAERGKKLFAERGCLTCHSHPVYPGSEADFGPELSKVHEKIERNADDPNFSDWLYTWLREPTRHNPRTKMPNLYLEPETVAGEQVDPAADITAFLLAQGEPGEFPVPEVDPEALDELTSLYLLGKQLTEKQTRDLLAPGGRYPFLNSGTIKGDEIELVVSGEVVEVQGENRFKVELDGDAGGVVTDRELVWSDGANANRIWKIDTYDASTQTVSLQPIADETGVQPPYPQDAQPGDRFLISVEVTPDMKLMYVGRRSISRYGCYGCHDIPGFQEARPIGTALQDWGRKDTSKLAPEHIEEWLHHHGEPDGSSTAARAREAVANANAGGVATGEFASEAEAERELAAAYFYDSLLHHGREGFIWQKLRQPRSYDYKKTTTKRYDERLKMPRFPFDEKQIEQVATFVLGLVAEPPEEDYLYRPQGPKAAVIEGNRLINKYNCAGCHMFDLPRTKFAVNLEEFQATPEDPKDPSEARRLLLELKPPRDALTGETVTVTPFESDTSLQLPVAEFRGMLNQKLEDPDYPDEYFFTNWEVIDVGGKLKLPNDSIGFTEEYLVEQIPARGGDFAEWLVQYLLETDTQEVKGDKGKAWQKSPPPLYKEGIKVQTQWLYNFLKNPGRLRHETVLRMPQFNMDDNEAQALADYFAAVDHASYPYQRIEPREPAYIAERTSLLGETLAEDRTYLQDCWKLLNGPLCIKCHSVGGRTAAGANDPLNNIRGPNLELATNRLRPEWTLVWLYKPAWITPYTSMPSNFPANLNQFPSIFDGDPSAQVQGNRDALFNYKELLETYGHVVFDPPMPDAENPDAAEAATDATATDDAGAAAENEAAATDDEAAKSDAPATTTDASKPDVASQPDDNSGGSGDNQ